MHQAQWSPERPLPPPVSLASQSHHEVQFLVWEDPMEKDMAPHSSILVWRIPWTEEPGGLQSMGLQELDMT